MVLLWLPALARAPLKVKIKKNPHVNSLVAEGTRSSQGTDTAEEITGPFAGQQRVQGAAPKVGFAPLLACHVSLRQLVQVPEAGPGWHCFDGAGVVWQEIFFMCFCMSLGAKGPLASPQKTLKLPQNPAPVGPPPAGDVPFSAQHNVWVWVQKTTPLRTPIQGESYT